MAFAVPKLATAFSNQRPSKDTRRIKDEAHLAFVRKLPSAVSGRYGCEACHIRSPSAIHHKKATGISQKPSDFWTLPLTPEEHRDQHSGAEMEWWSRHGIDPFDLASKLYEVTGDIEAGTAVLARATMNVRMKP